MNVRDSEIIQGLLLEKGYSFVDSVDMADIVIFNTCSVREHAAHKAISMMAQIAKRKKGKILGLVGCLAQHKQKELFKIIPELKFICGPSDLYQISNMLDRLKTNPKEKIQITKDQKRPTDYVNPSYRSSKTHAYVNIMYGCNNFCSYCIVPYVRNSEISRPVEHIVKEINELINRGIKDITFLGQNVNSYNGTSEIASSPRSIGAPRNDNSFVIASERSERSLPRRQAGNPKCQVNFVGLLKIINDLEGIEKISFMTSHPKDASMELFEAMRDLGKVKKALHLPLQSGSNKILKLMNRGYTIEKYMKLVHNYRKILPEGKLTTDFIVGFPEETKKDFDRTVMAVKEIQFNSAYIFKYSPRPPAKSCEMKDDVPVEEKKRRNNLLLNIQKEISKKKK